MFEVENLESYADHFYAKQAYTVWRRGLVETTLNARQRNRRIQNIISDMIHSHVECGHALDRCARACHQCCIGERRERHM